MQALTPDKTILGLLAFRSQHGYELLEYFRNSSELGEVWHLSTSQLYAVLKRLEREAYIVGEQIASDNAPPRTDYSLTGLGNVQLQTWLNDELPSPSIRCVRVEFLSRLYIARLLNIPTQPIVLRQKAVCQRQQNDLVLQRERIPPGMGGLAVEFVIAQLDAVLDWIDRCEMIPRPDKE